MQIFIASFTWYNATVVLLIYEDTFYIFKYIIHILNNEKLHALKFNTFLHSILPAHIKRMKTDSTLIY